MWCSGAALLLLAAFVQLALCAPDYYAILGVSKSATDKELKSAYRQLSKKFHPDKNPGDETAHDKFVEVAEAYDVLSDPETRKIYDMHGYDGFQKSKQGGGGGFHQHDPFDLFNSFFGGGGHFGGQRRGPNVEVRVAISLHDFYNGKTTEFQWEKQHICEKCRGSGSADGKVDKCTSCSGRGVKIVKHQLAPGMFQQIQTQCDVCGGKGQVIKNKCDVCGGARAVRKATTVPLTVARGALPGTRLVYEYEADASLDYEAGDLIVQLVEREPSLEDNPDRLDGAFFRRKENDLYWTEVLSLREAWMGDWSRNLTHLDGHIVTLKRERGEVVQPGHVETVAGEGMPIYHEDGDSVYHKYEFGKLYVEYTVVLPDQMDSGMEKEFWSVWQKWRGKLGVDLHKDSGRPEKPILHEEL